MPDKSPFKAFQKNPQNFRMLIESASEGVIIVDEAGRIVYANQRAEAMFGYRRQELIGEALEMLMPERFHAVHHGYRQGYTRAPERRNMGVGRDLVGLRKDGSEFPIEASLTPVKTDDGLFILSFLIDITPRKENELALRYEKERIQQYLDIAGVVLLVLNPDGTIEMINRRGCQVLGYNESDLVGKNWFDTCIPAPMRVKMRQKFNTIITQRLELNDAVTNPVLTSGGEERTILWHNIQLRDEQERITGVLSSGEDITERLHSEQQAKLHQQQLAQADKMATLGILVSGVAHEINNPTSFIMLNGKIFGRVWKDIAPILAEQYEKSGDFYLAGMPYSRAYDKITRLIEGVSDGAKRIERIVKSLKDFARQDTGELNEWVNINEVVESAIIIVNNLIKKSSDHFSVDYGDTIPKIRGNAQQLEQVIINLLTNACQALTRCDQPLSIGTAYREISNTVVIKVKDSGAGISQNNIRHIMDPFFTTKQSSGGTGLGLSISYNIIKEHGGLLDIKSELNRGTIAIVTLPVNGKPDE